MTTNVFFGIAFFAVAVLGSDQKLFRINKCTDIRQAMNAVADRGFEGCRRLQDVDAQMMTDADATLYAACNRKLATTLIDNADGSANVNGLLEYFRLVNYPEKVPASFIDELKQCYTGGDIVPKEQADAFATCGIEAYYKVNKQKSVQKSADTLNVCPPPV